MGFQCLLRVISLSPWRVREVRGQVQGKGQRVHVFREWVEVGALDVELDLLGVRDPGYAAADDGEEEDGLRWVIPTGPGEYRLSERTERIGEMREVSAGEDEGKKKGPRGCGPVQTIDLVYLMLGEKSSVR
ncbi:hypothetical protein [Ktedonobacter racemifer]|uniref:Uncharacterized protein n=1 Tax=Ktedonobacter racemifer DSM 44963 TaxID=485913 RepID=D6TVJ9_KTERA|nr:hypothetical protein [Ktedonobacter racemifer]EFH85402.1 hypothetical protein Krac_6621 [Ktedonobacter racemifer DSM 44963]